MDETRDIVLITGASGSIGGAISKALPPSCRIVGLNRKCRDPNADCVAIDFSSDQSVHEALATVAARYGRRIACVIHLAAYFDFTGEDNPQYHTVNVEGTRRLLRELQGFEVEQFVYASTMLVHAPTRPGHPITEDWPLQPKWPYPQSKVEAERVVREEHGDIPVVILRIAGVYTEDCKSPTLAHQIRRIYERQVQSHLLPADPSHGQAAVHQADLVAVFPRLIARRRQLPRDLVLLVAEPETMSYQDIQNEVGYRLHHVDWETIKIPKVVARSGAWLENRIEDIVPDALDHGVEPFVKPFMIDLAEDHYEIDITRAREYLDWQPQHRLRQDLPAMVERLKQDPVSWYTKNDLPLPHWLEEAGGLGEDSGPVLARHEEMLAERVAQTRWAHFANMSLGAWLISAPATMGYLDETALAANDMICGLLVLILALLSLSRRMGWAQWANAAVGFWLLFAPLLFWTPSAAAYASDTLVGALIMIFAVIVPPTPGVSVAARMSGPDIPPGWDYCPSTWHQRIPIIALAVFGFVISRYLAAYQLGHIDAVWDPFFAGEAGKNGTESIITSFVSEAWPVPDAGLGAMTYVLEILSGVIGSRRRWRTMPWVVILFGILIVPLGVTSIFFIIIQPVVLNTWCALCLIAALAMLVQVPYSLDEIIATGQFLRERVRAGRPFWQVFFRGDTQPGGRMLERPEFSGTARSILGDMLGGGVRVTLPLLLCVALGVWLMLTRITFGSSGAMANSDHIVGSLVVTFSIIAWAEVARPVRFINIPFGAWLILAPWVLSGATPGAAWASVITGVLLIGLSLPRGVVANHYAGWNRLLR